MGGNQSKGEELPPDPKLPLTSQIPPRLSEIATQKDIFNVITGSSPALGPSEGPPVPSMRRAESLGGIQDVAEKGHSASRAKRLAMHKRSNTVSKIDDEEAKPVDRRPTSTMLHQVNEDELSMLKQFWEHKYRAENNNTDGKKSNLPEKFLFWKEFELVVGNEDEKDAADDMEGPSIEDYSDDEDGSDDDASSTSASVKSVEHLPPKRVDHTVPVAPTKSTPTATRKTKTPKKSTAVARVVTKHDPKQLKAMKLKAATKFGDDQPLMKKIQKRKEHRENILKEIVASEQAYCKFLNLLILKFIDPMRNILPPEQMDSIFSNIAAIAPFHGTIEAELKKSRRKVVEVFNKYAPYLKVYTQYVNNYDNAMDTLDSLKGHKKLQEVCVLGCYVSCLVCLFAVFVLLCWLLLKIISLPSCILSSFLALFCLFFFSPSGISFKQPLQFLAQQRLDPELGGLNLTSFLIMPIQRIPRYRLLLEDLRKNTDKKSVERPILNKTLKQIRTIATKVNETKRRVEALTKLVCLLFFT